MTAPWFVAPEQDWHEGSIRLPEEESHHALKVLRVSPPDVITITDGRGTVARCSAARVEDGCLVAEILDVEQRRRLRPEIVVYQGAAKGHKLDDIVERLAELGVRETWVYQSERSVVRWDESKHARLAERWRAIARSAAKVSRNAYEMDTGSPLSWSELIRRVAREDFSIALWEEASLPVRAALVAEAERVALVVGPEGGLGRAEAESLADAGAQLTSLGPLILRTETAPVVAAAAVLYHYGLIG